jgi:hypothetical protein
MVCYLCSGGECECCAYVESRTQPPTSVPAFVIDKLNAKCALPAVSRYVKFHFIDNNVFTPITAEKAVASLGGSSSTDALLRARKRRKTANKAEAIRTTPVAYPDAVVRLVRFKKLLALLGTCHWANRYFIENEKILDILIGNHLFAIVGEKDLDTHRTLLYSLLNTPGQEEDIATIIHLLWITNRQQGKTWLLSRFYAALMMLSPMGGDLIDVYATLFKRSQAILFGAKRYIVECQTNPEFKAKLAELGMSIPRFKTENTETFTLHCCINESIENKIQACPCNVRSNRGNNALVIAIDEAAWVGRALIYEMIMPLLQVGGRVCTMITTPPEPENDFNDFIRQIRENHSLFTLRNHSLLCDDCLALNATRCVHKLGNIPSFKSVLKIEGIIRSMPANEAATLEAEVYGRIRSGKRPYFTREVVRAFIETAELAAPTFGHSPLIAISVDPPSHEVSCMGMAALAHTTSGVTVIIGSCEVPAERSGVAEVELCVRAFTRRVLEHHSLRLYSNTDVRVMAIIEANNCGILSKTITSAVQDEALKRRSVWVMPFIKTFFARDIVPDVGILCTETNKMEGIVRLYMAMVKRQVRFVQRMVTIGPIHQLNSRSPSAEEAKHKLLLQLVEFKDDKKGKVSGKTANTNDDQTMALIQGYNWLCEVIAIVSRK